MRGALSSAAMEHEESALRELREEIDRINRDILDLVQRRGEIVLRIGRLKKSLGLEGFDPRREDEMLDRLIRGGLHPYGASEIREIFRAIFRASLELQTRQPRTAHPSTNGGRQTTNIGETPSLH